MSHLLMVARSGQSALSRAEGWMDGSWMGQYSVSTVDTCLLLSAEIQLRLDSCRLPIQRIMIHDS